MFTDFCALNETLSTQRLLENVGGGIGQDPATKVTHLGLNLPPVFAGVYKLP